MSKNQNASDFDTSKTTIKCTGLMNIGFGSSAYCVHLFRRRMNNQSSQSINKNHFISADVWRSDMMFIFFEQHLRYDAICFPVKSCTLAFHQYRFQYSMKATLLASLHAMFPSCFDFATLTIAGPSLAGGVLLPLLLLKFVEQFFSFLTDFKCKFFNCNR